jgi:hypothetical protein
MAIKLTKTTASGLVAPDAYHRVENLSLANKAHMTFAVRSYIGTNKPAFNENYYSCAYDIDSENPIKQAYAYLKTLPEFTGAQDC